MYKKIILLLSLVLTTTVYAETCPSISDIKIGNFRHWRPLDIDNAEPVTGDELKNYRKQVASFAFANWMPDAPEGAGQCFYYGENPDVDYLGVYLAKHTGGPDKDFGNWHKVDFDLSQCNASINDCRYKSR